MADLVNTKVNKIIEWVKDSSFDDVFDIVRQLAKFDFIYELEYDYFDEDFLTYNFYDRKDLAQTVYMSTHIRWDDDFARIDKSGCIETINAEQLFNQYVEKAEIIAESIIRNEKRLEKIPYELQEILDNEDIVDDEI